MQPLTQALSLAATGGTDEMINAPVMLATVNLEIQYDNGKWQQIRCIMDSGSQAEALTERAVTQLKLKSRRYETKIRGVSGTLVANRCIKATIRSHNESYSRVVEFVVIPTLDPQPPQSLAQEKIDVPSDIILADEEFNESKEVDGILGAGIFFPALIPGLQQLSNGLRLQNSKFGWLVGGLRYNLPEFTDSQHDKDTSLKDLQESLERFWSIEELATSTAITQSGLSPCGVEELFRETTTIATDGRYMVRIPLIGELNDLGDSLQHGIKRLAALERRLARNKETYEEYKKFMKEYADLKHMTLVPNNQWKQARYIIPHSCVVKPESTTTKLRVVFDASAKTTSGLSLNDIQVIGPVIQPDLLYIWLDFRVHTVVATADITKMYRQIWVTEEDSWMQCILWREHPGLPIKMYRLRTVTYGEAASSFLACRALHQAGEEIRQENPRVADAIQRCFYVDNLSLGADTPEALQELRVGVEEALLCRGMPLRKWASNVKGIMSDIPHEYQDIPIEIGDREAIRVLGLAWSPSEDSFQLAIDEELLNPVKTITKRALVGRISRLYDPVGILQPVIVTAKILMQELAREDLAWDDVVPSRIACEWNIFISNLPLLRQLHIPRMAAPSNAIGLTLHGFCDASIKAYGCAFYVSFNTHEGNRNTRLLCAKSRVAPLKGLTLPRLELQAALLLADLSVRVKKVLHHRVTRSYWWSDSQVALTWIRSNNTRWDTFVTNRVSKIHSATEAADWRYVPTKLNPADIVSRGVPANKLIRGETTLFWLCGPTYLIDEPPATFNDPEETSLAETEAVPHYSTLLVANVGPTCDDIIAKYTHHNSFTRTRRQFAWISRAINNFKANATCTERRIGPLQLHELEAGLLLILKIMQISAFPNEMREVSDSGTITPHGQFQHLNPIIKNGLIYVRGRLGNAEIPDDAKSPILVPKSHPFSRVIVRYIHENNFHAGVELTLAEFKAKFWMRNLRRTIIGELSRCVVCIRARPRRFTQQIGQLPSARVNTSPAFTHTGVDLCGPFHAIPDIRSKRSLTIYVCLFVCFSTKAIHLEALENQSTSAFIAALLRFVSLRGRPDTIYSDNGRNFVGAAKELTELRKACNNRVFQDELVNLAAEKGINFSFIPPRSPNFGGLWEANIKVAKRLFKATARGARLTLIELQTLLHQISAILNSRPLTAVMSDPASIEPLTPAHFLIGRQSFAVPAASTGEDGANIKTRWRRVQYLTQQFWSRWRSEYLTQLRCAAKWSKRTPNVQVDQIVLVGDDNLPVGCWPLGIIEKTYEGPDGVVRVVDIRTSGGTYKRNVRLLAPLPMISSEGEIETAEVQPPSPETTVNIPGPSTTQDNANASTAKFIQQELEEDPPPSAIWDGRLRPKGGRMVPYDTEL